MWAKDTRARLACQARPGGLCPPWVPSGLRFSPVCLFPNIKNLYIPPEPVDHRIMEKSSVFFSCCFPYISENMSSQDSEGESYVADFVANPKSYGDVEHYGWTTEEEEDYYPREK